MKTKNVNESYTFSTEMVLPNDTNTLGNLMGGKLMHWIDIIAAIAAQKASNRTVVTASVDSVSFNSPIHLGEIVELEAQVTRAFTTSMEVRVSVQATNLTTGNSRHCNIAYLTFVAVDQNGNPIPVNQVLPQSKEENTWYEEALQRREMRLFLAGRIQLAESQELYKILNKS